MLFPRRNPDDIAGPDLTHRRTLGLNPADAGDDVKGLSEWMRMPGGPRARLKGHPVRDHARRRSRGDNRILPDRSGEILFWRTAARPRASEMDIHQVPPFAMDAIYCVLTIS